MRQNDKQSDFIDVANLRVGHYIYLDVGWMGHPFALNSFRISSEDQIATIRGLGLERLRFSPAQSRLPEEAPGNPAAEATVSLTSKPEDKSGEGPSTPNAETSMTAEAASPAATAPAAPSPLTPKELRR